MHRHTFNKIVNNVLNCDISGMNEHDTFDSRGREYELGHALLRNLCYDPNAQMERKVNEQDIQFLQKNPTIMEIMNYYR